MKVLVILESDEALILHGRELLYRTTNIGPFRARMRGAKRAHFNADLVSGILEMGDLLEVLPPEETPQA